MKLTQAQRDELSRRQAALSAIIQSPHWPGVQEEMDRMVAQAQKRAQTIALAPNGANQRVLDEIRGYIRALKWLRDAPEAAEGSLKAYLDRIAPPEDEE